MGFYNVVAPCVVGKLHYARPTAAPIEVDDDVAGPLVATGYLEKYQPGEREPLEWLAGAAASDDAPRPVVDDEPHSEGAVQIVAPEPEGEKPTPRPRGNRRTKG